MCRDVNQCVQIGVLDFEFDQSSFRGMKVQVQGVFLVAAGCSDNTG